MTCLDTYLSMAATEAGVEPGLACGDRPRAILIGYLFNAFNLSELQKRLEQVFGFGFERSVRKQMVKDKKVMCEMKFALYQTVAARHRYRTLPELRQHALSVGLAEEDLPLVSLVISHSGLSAHFDKLFDAGYKALTFSRFNMEVTRVINDQARSVRGYAYTKLTFLKRWGVKIEDSILDCESRAFEALLLHYPCFETREHFQNLYKAAIRQAGNKLIAYHTTKSRNVFDEHGKPRVDSLVIATGDGEFSLLDITQDEGAASGLTGGDTHTDEATMVIHQLLGSEEITDHDRKFLTLLAGETDSQFERWMQDERGVQDIERVINGQTPRYRRLVMEYLHYPTTKLRHIQHLLTNVNLTPARPTIVLQPTVEQVMTRKPSVPRLVDLARPARLASSRIVRSSRPAITFVQLPDPVRL